MGNLVKTVNSVENKITRLLEVLQKKKEEISSLKEALDKRDSTILELKKQLASLTHENHSLKTANAMLGSKEYKKETKLKINSMIKDINHCITQLSE